MHANLKSLVLELLIGSIAARYVLCTTAFEALRVHGVSDHAQWPQQHHCIATNRRQRVSDASTTMGSKVRVRSVRPSVMCHGYVYLLMLNMRCRCSPRMDTSSDGRAVPDPCLVC